MCIKTYAKTNIKINKIYRIYKEKYVKIQRVYKRYIKSVFKNRNIHTYILNILKILKPYDSKVCMFLFLNTLFTNFLYTLYIFSKVTSNRNINKETNKIKIYI